MKEICILAKTGKQFQAIKNIHTGEISDFHSNEHSSQGLPGSDTMQCYGRTPTFGNTVVDHVRVGRALTKWVLGDEEGKQELEELGSKTQFLFSSSCIS